LNSVRTAVINEFENVSQGISSINQSYYYSGVESPGAMTAGSSYEDTSKCITVAEPYVD